MLAKKRVDVTIPSRRDERTLQGEKKARDYGRTYLLKKNGLKNNWPRDPFSCLKGKTPKIQTFKKKGDSHSTRESLLWEGLVVLKPEGNCGE